MILGIIITVTELNKVLSTVGQMVLGSVGVCMLIGSLAGLALISQSNKQSIIKSAISIISTMALLYLAIMLWRIYVVALYLSSWMGDINVIVKVIIIFLPLVLEFMLISLIVYTIHRYLKTHYINWFNKKK
jgi:riboflavin transporter FmnP